MDISYRRYDCAEAASLAHFLTRDDWPYHATRAVDRDTARQWISEGRFEGDENRTFWMIDGEDTVVGLIRLMDLADDTPLFDLRIGAGHRGRGLGVLALKWLTGYLFTEFPEIRRIEGTTRQDNRAMRRTFVRCGYVKEAHYRDAWPGSGGTVHDAVGYAILRRDWDTGTTTLPEWDDEPVTMPSGEGPDRGAGA